MNPLALTDAAPAPPPANSEPTWMDVEYLGGNPDQERRLDGTVSFTGGGLTFAATIALDGIPPKFDKLEWRLEKDDIRAISLGSRDYVRMLARGAAGAMLGGSIGGLIGMATGQRKWTLLVACERDGLPFTAVFGVTPKNGRWFIDAIQKIRRAGGEPPIPTIEEAAKQDEASQVDEQTQPLIDIRELVRQQVALLSELVAERAMA
jgi:hypothetical protein